MATLRLFAGIREAAGVGRVTIDAATVGDVVAQAVTTYGADFEALLPTCKIWVNGEPADHGDAITSGDEVALLPPVSGG